MRLADEEIDREFEARYVADQVDKEISAWLDELAYLESLDHKAAARFKARKKCSAAYPNMWPTSFSLENWQYVLKHANLGKPILNSLFIATATTLASFLLALPTAYAIGRRDLRFKQVFKTAMLLPMVLPGMAMSIYVGRVIYAMGLSGTYPGLILAHMLGGIPYMLRILVVSFESMPQDILDAASNLGAGPWVRLKEVYMPMLIPSVLAASIFTFIGSIENFTMSFIIGLPEIKTMPTVLFSYLGEGFTPTRASVVSMIMTLPTLLIMLWVEHNVKTEYMGAALGKM